MNILKWIKGKKKQIENRKLTPNEDFEFEKDYFGEIDIIDGFKIIYCNNYTDKLYNSNKNILSFISSVVSLPKTEKILENLINFINIYYRNNLSDFNAFRYDNIFIEIKQSKINIYLRGDLGFYRKICDNIHNNIITKYIRNNLFPNELSIDTPNEFLDNMYNSITYPNKEIDILFIEDKFLCNDLNPIIGLSINHNSNNIDLNNKYGFIINNRFITYCEINSLSENELNYIINNVTHGNNLLNILHKDIEQDDINTDIDEIIEN